MGSRRHAAGEGKHGRSAGLQREAGAAVMSDIYMDMRGSSLKIEKGAGSKQAKDQQ
jgi:hypothetical protein